MGKRVFMAAVTLLALGVFGVSSASAATKCKEQTLSGQIKDNVSAGPGCKLSAATVKGNVTVEPAGSLVTENEVNIMGNVMSNEATEIILEATGSIAGNVQIKGTTGVSVVAFGKAKGNVEIESSLAFLTVGSESVGGNVQLTNNTGSGGGGTEGAVEVFKSTVAGAVMIHDNALDGTVKNEVGAFRNGPPAGSIGGNLQVFNNTAKGGSGLNEVFAETSKVGGNLEVHNNIAEGPAGSINAVEVGGNTVKNNLACMNDKPPATDTFHGENHAKTKTGECANL
jgi:hypothetical protein